MQETHCNDCKPSSPFTIHILTLLAGPTPSTEMVSIDSHMIKQRAGARPMQSVHLAQQSVLKMKSMKMKSMKMKSKKISLFLSRACFSCTLSFLVEKRHPGPMSSV